MSLRNQLFALTRHVRTQLQLTDDFKLAAYTGDSERMLLAADKLGITEQSEWGHVLTRAAAGGHTATLDVILAQLPLKNGNALQSWLDTALDAAAENKQAACVKHLLRKGATVEAISWPTFSTLMAEGRHDIADMLVTAGYTIRTDRADELIQTTTFSNNPETLRYAFDKAGNHVTTTGITLAVEHAETALLEDVLPLLKDKMRGMSGRKSK